MKKIKVLIVLFYVVMSGLQGVAKAQMIVTDPSLEAVNITGFTKDLGNGIEQLQTLLKNFNVAEEQLKRLQEARDVLTKVGQWTALLDRAQSSIRMASYCIHNISEGVQTLSDKEFSVKEVQNGIRFFNYSLSSVNSCISNVTSLITDATSMGKGVQMDQVQRKEQLEKEEEAVRQHIETTGEYLDYLNDRRTIRRIARENIRHNESMATHAISNNKQVLAMAMPSDLSGESGPLDLMGSYDPLTMDAGIEWNFSADDIKAGLQKQGFAEGSKKGMQQAKKAYSKATDNALKLFYAISGIIGVIGAVRCYTLWNLGESITKPAFTWFGTTLFLVIIGNVVRLFF